MSDVRRYSPANTLIKAIRNGSFFCYIPIKTYNIYYMFIRIKMQYKALLYAQTYRCLDLPTLNGL